MLAFMRSLQRPLTHRAMQLWAWLFPVTYLIHIAEEYFAKGGYSAYIYRLRGIQLSNTRFLIAQSIGVILIVAAVIIARRLHFSEVMIVILGATVLVNGVTHIITSGADRSYGPGLWSSIFIWLPLGAASLIRFYPLVKHPKYWIALAIGIGINIVVTIFTLQGGKF
jgi:uncharacterized membrane protein HdeD (DUF308 family)